MLDALDECQGIEGNKPQAILACLRDHPYQVAPCIRILLTSRRENHLCRELTHQPQVVEHDLNDDDASTQEDIARFLKDGLSVIQEKWGIRVKDWPREEDVETLLKKSGCLFIFAKTALHFIGDDQVSDPQDQMNILLGMVQTTINAYTPLDELYYQVLKNALPAD